DDLHARQERSLAGVSAQEQANTGQAMSHLLMKMQKMFKDMLDPDLAPPEMRQAHEKIAEQMQAAQQGPAFEQFLNLTPQAALAGAMGLLAQGRSAAEAARLSPRGQKILAELEAYAAKKQGPA